MRELTVFVTGRSRSSSRTTRDLPGTIDETARLVSEAGGNGVPIACDHADDLAVEALAGAIGAQSECLDILVNNVWGGYEQFDQNPRSLPLWEQPIWRWDRMFQSGVRAHYTSSRVLIPLMLGGQMRLIANIAAGDDGRLLGDVQYDVAKAAIDRLGIALARTIEQ